MMSLADLDQEDRNGFVRKVYMILSVQLLVTFGGVALTKMTPKIDNWIKGQTALAISLSVCSFIV